jgi:hypothetical protein
MAKAYFIKSLIFVLISATLLGSLHFAHYQLILKNSKMVGVERELYENMDEIEILFLGDSRPMTGVDPAFIDNSFNFTSPGENYIQTYYKLKSVLANGDFKPKIIVMPIDLQSFSSYRAHRFKNEWYWCKYINFVKLAFELDDMSIIVCEINGILSFKGKGREIITSIFKPQHIIEETNIDVLYRGFLALDKKFSDEARPDSIANLRAGSHLANQNALDEDLLRYFMKTVDLVLSKNITILLVKYPITEMYFDVCMKYIPDVGNFYKSVISRLNGRSNYHMIDYQTFENKNLQIFADSDHLNREGAKLFSQVLNEDIERILGN